MSRGRMTVIAMIVMLALSGWILALSGCHRDQYVCEIEYMDGERERVKCYYAHDGMFGDPPVLTIETYGNTMRKSLATIKRWRLIKLEKPDGEK